MAGACEGGGEGELDGMYESDTMKERERVREMGMAKANNELSFVQGGEG